MQDQSKIRLRSATIVRRANSLSSYENRSRKPRRLVLVLVLVLVSGPIGQLRRACVDETGSDRIDENVVVSEVAKTTLE